MDWLDEIEQKLKAATPGPWKHVKEESLGYGTFSWVEPISSRPSGHVYASEQTIKNHGFIAASPEMVAKLIAAVRMAEKALIDIANPVVYCYACGDEQDTDSEGDDCDCGDGEYVYQDDTHMAQKALAQLQSGDFQTGKESGS